MSLEDLPLLERARVYIDETVMPEQVRQTLTELLAEVERLRSYKSLPCGMVWQDYYSPDDVCKIREPLDAEIERLRAEVEELRGRVEFLDHEFEAERDRAGEHFDSYMTARFERDQALAEVERLRPRQIETVEQLDALPIGSVVRDECGGDVWEKYEDSPPWQVVGMTQDFDAPYLPALLLWSQEAH